jgi:phage terminase large subunit-like protein
MGVRLGADPRIAITTTPKPITALRTLRGEESCVVTHAGTAANAAENLAPAVLESLQALYGGSRRAAQEIEGLLVEGESAALWRAADLLRVRGAAPPAFHQVVVAVDPPAGDRGAACGIVVAGRVETSGFVLADRSAQGLSPLAWARRAGAAASEFGANLIVAEANQGGDMVRITLQAAGVTCPIGWCTPRAAKASAPSRSQLCPNRAASPIAAPFRNWRSRCWRSPRTAGA